MDSIEAKPLQSDNVIIHHTRKNCHPGANGDRIHLTFSNLSTCHRQNIQRIALFKTLIEYLVAFFIDFKNMH